MRVFEGAGWDLLKMIAWHKPKAGRGEAAR
jgi:hypothetical protein